MDVRRNPFVQHIGDFHIVLLEHHQMTVAMNVQAGQFDVFVLHASLRKEFRGAVIERRPEGRLRGNDGNRSVLRRGS